ncbi:division plane positioning ATPase MipZ [Pseudokordiimonas caeni]|uniref:division plane positioning ATPase MipZ n=1 Tax=Pseudokordiimonas caeni TaxID=2997908 RepID=UPI002811A4FB|nr:division plane positioning ATPase MipZ [Pseudokordiimonas caeni]
MTTGQASTNTHMPRRPYVIVLGNEKGGSGKSTTAMHIVVSLLREGFRVGTIDLDGRQKSLTRYIENRRAYCKANDVELPMPLERVIVRSTARTSDEAEADEKMRFEDTYVELMDQVDVIVIDCPGSDTFLSRLAHTAADTLVTPINDSFVDLDLIARIDPKTYRVAGPSLYAEMVWKARQRRQMADGGTIDWVLLRNRVGAVHAKNKERVESVVEELTKRIGVRYIPGLGERVIYRELFPNGLTLMDLRDEGVSERNDFSMSHVAARQELRALMDGLNLAFRREKVA